MNCTEFQQRLEAAVDERQLIAASDLSAHVAGCFACSELWNEYLLLEAAISDWRGRRVEVDLTERVLADYRVARAAEVATKNVVSEPSPTVTLVRVPEQSSGMKWWPMLIPAVAALALAVMVLINRSGPREQEVAQPELQSPLQQEEFADLSEIVDDAKSAWLGLARSTAARTKGLSVFLPNLKSSDGEEGAAPPMEAEMLDDMNNGLTPVPNEFRRAFEFLIDASQWDESQTT